MKILDTAITEIVKGNSARYYSKYIVDGKEYTNTLNKFNFQNITNPNNEITIGNTCASSVAFSIYMPQVSLENKEITIYEGVKVGNEIKYIKLGTFTVSKQTSNGEYTSYEAYDKMYKADMPYSSDLAFPSTDKAILNEICGKLGISLATNIVTAHTINDKPQGYTYREIIGYMAMLQGCNAVINADGNLELRWYKDSGYVLDGHKYYQQGVTFTTSKDFIIQKLTCNNTKSGDKETSTITSGSGATGLSFANPFMTQAILDEVYKKIGGFQFRPLTVKFVGDWRLEPGDIITVNKSGVDYKVPIMQITHECDGGLMDTIASIGQSDTENTNIASGPITKQMERYYAELVTINQALINKLDVDTAKITYATITNLNATNASIDNLKTNKLDATYADIINANVESLKAANAEIIKLKANSLTADIADLKYAQIDFANVKGQVVGTSLIKDGAVTNEKVQSLSANKLTAGTIDASKITVTNLNADNLTVGTINGKLIGNGSVDLNKLSQEVPTKEYLDNVQKELQGQIDGAIETFTKSEIPTLNNEPANAWTDNETRKKHIGDVCYVLNPASSADGYCYRFANTGTEASPQYEWVLIKDSDVTKALQDIIDINGEITGIKQFDTEISSWKTDTDAELSSLKSRTTTLETDIGTKVETSVFNSLKQTVDENSSSITSLSTAVSKKADNSTVEELTNTVNSVKQTADTNTSSISSMQTTIKNKADSSTVTALSNKTSELEQSLNGFKTTVSDTYATKTALNNYSTTEQMNSAITQTANSITNTVSSTYTTKTEFNNLEIGGRNLATDTNKGTTNWGWIMQAGNYTSSEVVENGIRTCKLTRGTTAQSGWSVIFYWNIGRSKWEPNTVYTVSLDVKASVSTDIWLSFLLLSGIDSLIKESQRGHITTANTWTKLIFVVTSVDVLPSSTGQVVYLFGMNSGTGVWYQFKNLKIEKGNKATDWTPAPEDVDTAINTVDEKFANYATTASLDLYIKKDPTSGELKSAIEAIADDITLNASGTINISGNKSVNINGNLFTLTSTNTTIASDGSIDCKKLKAVNADLEGTFKNVNVTTEGITMTTTLIGGEYLMKSSTGAYLKMQGHFIALSNEDGTEQKVSISRDTTSFNNETHLNGITYVNNYSNLKIYHPSIKQYMQPALCATNPITFEWSGNSLFILVDDTIIATWDWAEQRWY